MDDASQATSATETYGHGTEESRMCTFPSESLPDLKFIAAPPFQRDSIVLPRHHPQAPLPGLASPAHPLWLLAHSFGVVPCGRATSVAGLIGP